MNILLRSGLIAGAIGGEAVVLLVLVNTIIIRDFTPVNMTEGTPAILSLWGIFYPLLIIVVFEAGGMLSAQLAKKEIRTRAESLLVGFITGIMISIFLEIMWIANILSLAAHTLSSSPGSFMGYGSILLTICLMIVLVLMGGVLSSFGSYIVHEISTP
jgi:hypothetical protein